MSDGSFEEDEDEGRALEDAGEAGDAGEPPPSPGPTGADLAVIGGAMLASLVLLGTGFVFCKQISDLGEDLDTIQAKAGICKNFKPGGPPTAASTAGGKPGQRSETKVLKDGEEPPLQVELRSFTDGKATYVRLGSKEVLPAGEVTVMNLWATWCHPCVEELPALRGLFERHGGDWGDKAKFLPVLTEDQAAVETAFKDFKDKMPKYRRFLVEFGGFTESLEKKKMWRSDLPVTMVIGCRQRVRWLRFGELGAPEINELEGTVSALIAELETAECKKDVASCGDGNCTGMENKITCLKDCKDVIICGDTICDPPSETKEKCPSDCSDMKCGDQICGEGETFRNCPKDCRRMCPIDLKCKPGFKCEKGGNCIDENGFMQQ